MLKLKFAVCFIFLVCIELNAQKIPFKKYKDKYPEASYIVLENKIEVSYFLDKTTNQLKARSKHSISMLALTDDTDELELIQIPFSKFEKAEITAGRYYILDSLDEKLSIENVKTKFAETKDYFINGIFYTDLKVRQFASSHQLTEKTLLNYSYEITYDDLKFLNRFMVQERNENVELFELKIRIPSYVNAETKMFNLDDSRFKKSEENVTGEKIITYRLEEIRTLILSSNPAPQTYFLPHFVILTNSYEAAGKKNSVLSSTDDLYKWYNSLISELKPDKALIDITVQRIIKNKNTDEDKVDAIFKWVQNNINYVAFEDGIAGFKPEESANVARLKYGDCKGMANLLVDLLKSAGLNSFHTWIGTRHINYDYSLPSLIVDNHMICTVSMNDKYYFLDATGKFNQWDKIPYYLQGKQALIGKGATYEVFTLPKENAENNSIKIDATADLTAKKDPLISGTITLSGHYFEIIQSRFMYSGIKEKKTLIQEYLNRLLKNVLVIKTSLVNTDTKTNEVKLNFEGKGTGIAVYSTGKSFLLCDIDNKFSAAAVDTFSTPWFFDFPEKIIVNMKYKLPASMSSVKVPENVSYSSLDNTFSFKTNYIKSGSEVNYSKSITINTNFVSMNEFPEWEKFVGTLIKEYDNPVITN